MRITDLPKTKDILMNNLFITDGEGGTRAMFAEDLARALYAFLTDEEKASTVDFAKILSTQTTKATDKILLDTDEGNRAISLKDLQYAFMDAVANVPQRRNTFRGKNLGSSVTEAQLNEIGNGTFRDLFIGDYWEINNNKWRIADMDYWLVDGVDQDRAKHHLVIMPDYETEKRRMNPTATTEGGWVGTELWNAMKIESNPTNAAIRNAFGSHLQYSHIEWFSNAVSNGYCVGASAGVFYFNLPTAMQMIGDEYSAQATNPQIRWIPQGTPNQFALFKLEKKYIYTVNSTNTDSQGMWLSDVYNDNSFACLYIAYHPGAHVDMQGAQYPMSIRPHFSIYQPGSTKRIMIE